MTKKDILPSILFCVRIVLLATLITSLVLDEIFLFGVVFIMVAILDICDTVLYKKTIFNYTFVGIVSRVVSRLLYIVPLLFLTIYKNITVWIFIILLFFEITIGLYRLLTNANGKRRIVVDVMFIFYTLALWLAIFLSLFFKTLGVAFVFASSVFGTVFIIYSSVLIKDEEKDEMEEVEEVKSEIEKTIASEESDEIFE